GPPSHRLYSRPMATACGGSRWSRRPPTGGAEFRWRRLRPWLTRRDLGSVPCDAVVAQPPGQGCDRDGCMVLAVPRGIQLDVQGTPRADDVQWLQAKAWVL